MKTMKNFNEYENVSEDSLNENNNNDKKFEKILYELNYQRTKLEKIENKVDLIGKLMGNIIKENNLKYDKNIS